MDTVAEVVVDRVKVDPEVNGDRFHVCDMSRQTKLVEHAEPRLFWVAYWRIF